MSVHKWGESPLGRWTLRIETREPQNRESKLSAQESGQGELSYFGLRLFGSNPPENHKISVQKRDENNAFVPTLKELQWIYERELSIRQTPNVMKKRDYKNLLNERENHKENQDRSMLSLFREKIGF